MEPAKEIQQQYSKVNCKFNTKYQRRNFLVEYVYHHHHVHTNLKNYELMKSKHHNNNNNNNVAFFFYISASLSSDPHPVE
mmetsp:Transcript_51634/g.57672  ORF Transcript_51634/g.57672 Transcript_51634/m.57672 type:complete len:80 (-) Transcript_51634:505-744(-)